MAWRRKRSVTNDAAHGPQTRPIESKEVRATAFGQKQPFGRVYELRGDSGTPINVGSNRRSADTYKQPQSTRQKTGMSLVLQINFGLFHDENRRDTSEMIHRLSNV